MPSMPGWSEGLDLTSRQGLCSFGTKGEMQFSQPGRAVQRPLYFSIALCGRRMAQLITAALGESTQRML